MTIPTTIEIITQKNCLPATDEKLNIESFCVLKELE